MHAARRSQVRVRQLIGWLLAFGFWFCIGCSSDGAPRTHAEAVPALPAAREATHVEVAPRVPGDSERGRNLVQRFECNRCHEGTGFAAAPRDKHCFSCHEEIATGRFPVSAAALARFRPHVASAREAPSLTAIDARLEPDWIRGFLLAPHDLRPRLVPTMPRLDLDATQAADIAAYLTRGAPAPETTTVGNPARGRQLMEDKGCAGCHAFSGVASFATALPEPNTEQWSAAALAPDLRFTRERFRADRIVAWLRDPARIKPDTRMPNFGLAEDEARNIAAYVLSAPLEPERRSAALRLPVLARRVSFEEVNAAVFSRTCHHCHTDADSAGGDGGPGNTGGFGFAPRGVSFSSYGSIAAGYIDVRGQRRSLFEPLADGTPRLVAAVLARHDEENGVPRADVRGMPLGLPALAPEQIQLVESWVAQGRPQ